MAKHRVLLVEDNEELREMYRDIFRHNNFEVLEAADGMVAVEEAVTNEPQVVVLDLMLPRQGGIHALKIMRSLPETRHVPVIILTALPNQDYRQEAERLVQGYFLKTSVKPQELVDTVLKLINEKE